MGTGILHMTIYEQYMTTVERQYMAIQPDIKRQYITYEANNDELRE